MKSKIEDMSETTARYRNDLGLMIFAVIAAVLIHVIAIFAAKEMKLDFASSGKALMENQKAPRFEHNQQAAKLQEETGVKMRNWRKFSTYRSAAG